LCNLQRDFKFYKALRAEFKLKGFIEALKSKKLLKVCQVFKVFKTL
jgi:hypothetical protein